MTIALKQIYGHCILLKNKGIRKKNKIPKKYRYLSGPGEATSWNQSLLKSKNKHVRIELCGKNVTKHKKHN